MIKAAGAIVYRKSKGFLLLKKKNFWEFPKGRVDVVDQDIKATAVREVQEETSLKDLSFVEGFHEVEHYRIGKEEKTVDYFLCTTKSNPSISSEHLGYAWCTEEEVMQLLSFESKKHIFMRAVGHLQHTGRL